MVMINGVGSIENRVRQEARNRADLRRQMDIRSGLTRSSGPARGDYKLCREQDKMLNDYRRYKDPNDRAKIQAQMDACKRDYQRNHVAGRERVIR